MSSSARMGFLLGLTGFVDAPRNGEADCEADEGGEDDGGCGDAATEQAEDNFAAGGGGEDGGDPTPVMMPGSADQQREKGGYGQGVAGFCPCPAAAEEGDFIGEELAHVVIRHRRRGKPAHAGEEREDGRHQRAPTAPPRREHDRDEQQRADVPAQDVVMAGEKPVLKGGVGERLPEKGGGEGEEDEGDEAVGGLAGHGGFFSLGTGSSGGGGLFHTVCDRAAFDINQHHIGILCFCAFAWQYHFNQAVFKDQRKFVQ